MIEWLLIILLHTDRAASHGHLLEISRKPTYQICIEEGTRVMKDPRDTFSCVEVTALPKKN